MDEEAAAFAQYLAEIEHYAPLDSATERQLAERIRACDAEALDQLVRANLRVVIPIVQEYVGRGVSRDDLVNEGNLGVIRAAHRYAATAMEERFAAFADAWIRAAGDQAVAAAAVDQVLAAGAASALRHLMSKHRPEPNSRAT